MTKPARPHPILGEALTRNQYTTWSGLRDDNGSVCMVSLVAIALQDFNMAVKAEKLDAQEDSFVLLNQSQDSTDEIFLSSVKDQGSLIAAIK